MDYVATWEAQPKRGPFAGYWRVMAFSDPQTVCSSEHQIWSATREGIKEALHNRGNGHPVKFID